MMHFQEDVFNDRRLAMPTAEGSTMAATWSAVLEERHRMACEIHDTLAQAFAGILLHLEAVPETVAASGQLGSDSAERLACARHLAQSGLEDSRRMLLGLRPKSLDGTGLVEALRALAQRCAGDWGIACKFRFLGQGTDLSPNVQDEFYRIAQEALCNVRKHSRATSVSITLSCNANRIALTIKDNGQGFVDRHAKTASEGFGLPSMGERAIHIGSSRDSRVGPLVTTPAEPRWGYGFGTMRERVQRIGGELKIESPKKGGAFVRVRVLLAKTGESRPTWRRHETGEN